MKNFGLFKIILLSFGIFSVSLSAQKINSNNVKTTVSGTSTLHDWTMTSDNGTFSGNVSGNTIQDIHYSINGKSLKSGKNGMDKNA
ncbi:hypothetical protein [Halpernia frigidisoli]|uniref:hypothetical protein n=1 Tax=Halpernia frigidisoli TaxID=1125876 RepID=UPI000B7E706B|nr:hypothetical protein [Halpernia frigidisoli]